MSEKSKIADIREEYTRGELDESSLDARPMPQFERWFQDALDHEVMEPNAMVLSTVSAANAPSSRVVLLKGMDETGFEFYTNYESRKGQEIAANAQVALLFFWPELQRQVRIEGLVTKIDTRTSDAYFYSRPVASQLGALASPQSRVVPSREFLDQQLVRQNQEFSENKRIERPPYWGGYKVIPQRIEFWQGRASRMHDRLVYTLDDSAENRWIIQRLAP